MTCNYTIERDYKHGILCRYFVKEAGMSVAAFMTLFFARRYMKKMKGKPDAFVLLDEREAES